MSDKLHFIRKCRSIKSYSEDAANKSKEKKHKYSFKTTKKIVKLSPNKKIINISL